MEGGCSFEDGTGLCFPFFFPPPPLQGGCAGQESTTVSPMERCWGEGDHLGLRYQPGPWLLSIFGKPGFY